MTTSMCETPEVATYEPSERLQAAVEAVREAEAIYASAMDALYQAIADEVAKPNRPADVARALSYHPGHIRRIARERGVPGFFDREPPRRRPAEPDQD